MSRRYTLLAIRRSVQAEHPWYTYQSVALPSKVVAHSVYHFVSDLFYFMDTNIVFVVAVNLSDSQLSQADLKYFWDHEDDQLVLAPVVPVDVSEQQLLLVT